MARKAFFTRQANVNASAVAIMVFSLLSALSFKSRFYRSRKTPAPGAETPKDPDRYPVIFMVSLALLFAGFLASAAGFAGAMTNTVATGKKQGSQTAATVLDEAQKDKRQNWTALRGADNLGVVYNYTGNLNGPFKEAWKTKNPKPGFNSPIVWKDKVFFSGGDESGLFVYCCGKRQSKKSWGKSQCCPKSDRIRAIAPRLWPQTAFACSPFLLRATWSPWTWTVRTSGKKALA
jgi:hypothetical protein